MTILKNFIIKEFLQFRRDRKMLGVVLVAPIIQLIFLGYAANRDLNNIKTVILDNDKSFESRKLIESFEKSGYFSLSLYTESYEKLTEWIDKGEALIAIVIPRDFQKKLNSNSTADIQIIIDGSDGNKASIAGGYVQTIVSGFARNVVLTEIERSGIKVPFTGSIEPEARIWYNPELLTRNYMLPSIVGLILIVVTTIVTSLAIAKERELGTLEQLMVTPIKSYQLILGKLIPFSIIGFISMTLVLLVMRFWFGIEIKGSVILLFASSSLFMLSTLGLGLFVSTISKTQQQAMITSAFLVIMPMIFLSGFAFPIENMPKAIQFLSHFIPLKYFIIVIRGIVIKGLGIEQLWKEMLIMLLMGVLILVASSLRFSKKLK